jgi:hypothetical protein
MSGMIGMSGHCGYIGFSGCFGNPFCFGSMSGCFGGYFMPTQAYSRWAPSPNKAYYHRTLTIQTPAPNETAFEFVMVHYPDRPKFFYYYDPVDKKYFGRYRLGAPPTESFQVLQFNDRKASLSDIKDSAYRNTSGMPPFSLIVRPKQGTTLDATLQNLKLLRPPETVPDALLGLPPEEPPVLKKAPEKK